MNMMGNEEAISSLREGMRDYYYTLKVSMLACLKFYMYRKAPSKIFNRPGVAVVVLQTAS